ncbi:MAG: Y-family DNA polymerase [Bacteriovoracaceae bacterium]|nr:Y-family DNA polymerase [Bacteriovoracaceae bacterium]
MSTFGLSHSRHLFALADGNSFFCSCEMVFRPELIGKPVVVLSNNDGCIVSRSDEAKQLGIPMGVPLFQIKELVAQKKVHVFSSNFPLYADMSKRMMKVLSEFASEMEVYSVDECFLELGDIPIKDLNSYLLEMKRVVLRDTGIPVCIGVGPTKVLAKAANKIAKQSKKETQGIYNLSDPAIREAQLKKFSVENIWGIGRQNAKKCKSFKIETAWDFANANIDWVQKNFTIVGKKIALELQGISCSGLQTEIQDKKQIISSRSFGRPVLLLEELRESVANHITSAAEKLRKQKSITRHLTVWITTNPLSNSPTPFYYNAASMELPTGSAHTPKLIHFAFQLLSQIYRGGYEYKKAGVIFNDIHSKSQVQLNFFSEADTQQEDDSMKTVDGINQDYGKGTVKSAACGINQFWKMRSEQKSPCYTTRWSELLVVKN